MIYLELLWTFFKIGIFTFGGGYAMLPLIQEEVAAHGWMESSELINFVAVSESTPGPFAVNIATYIGAETGGVLGAVCATFGVVLPSFIVILIVAKCFERFKNSKIVMGCMTGLKPAVVGLIGASALSVAGNVFMPNGFSFSVFSELFFAAVVIFLLSLLLVFKKVHPVFVIVISAVLGVVSGYLFS